MCRSRRWISSPDPFPLSESLVGHDQLQQLRLFCCCSGVFSAHRRERQNICGRSSLEKCGFSSVCVCVCFLPLFKSAHICMIRSSLAACRYVQVFYEVTDQYMSVLKVRQAARTAASMHSTLHAVKPHHLLSVTQQYHKYPKAP